jgi:23S rRNA (cytidine1920-2'-O)/16S rRNA (cytidine1409-2'-O)-methyltransferase
VTTRRRLDAELVRRNLVVSRREAADLIAGGRVLVAGAPADKPARLVSAAEAVHIVGAPPKYVSRGGEKLAGALDDFGVDPAGWRVLDAGASTGGFTDCVLQRGAAHVVAVDVGHGQLHPKIRNDDRVTAIEKYNVRRLDLSELGGQFDLAVADLSFISLTKVLDRLLGALVPGGHLVCLVKPQFEAGRAEVSKGRGVITDPAVHERVRDDIETELRSLGATVLGWVTSSLRGADGNVEFLVHARAPREHHP